jgi:hypothetical protein
MGFGGFGTRRIRDKYGEEYDVPEDLFDGAGDNMARAYVQRERADRQASQPRVNRSPYRYQPPDEILNPQERYDSRSFYRPEAMARFGIGAAKRVPEMAFGLGRMMTQSPSTTAVEMGTGLWGDAALEGSPGRVAALGAAESVSPIPFSPVRKVFNKNLDYLDRAEAAGSLLPDTLLALWGLKGALTPKLRPPIEPGPIMDPARLLMDRNPQRPRTFYAGKEGIAGNPMEAEFGGPLREPGLASPDPLGELAIPDVQRTANAGMAELEGTPSPAQMGIHSWNRGQLGLAPSRIATDSPNRVVFEGLVPERISRPPAESTGIISEPSQWEMPGKIVDLSEGPVPTRPVVQPELLPAAGPGARGMSTKAPRGEFITKDTSIDTLIDLEKQGYVHVSTNPDGSFVMKHDPVKAAKGKALETSVLENAKKDPSSRTAAQYAEGRQEEIAKASGFISRNTEFVRGAREWAREHLTESNAHALGRMGQHGKDLLLAAERADADSFRFSGKQVAAIDKALEAIPNRRLRKEYFEKAVDHIEAGDNSTDPHIQSIVNVLREQDAIGNQLYTTSGMKTQNPVTKEVFDYKPRENYFTHKYPEGFEVKTDLINELVKEEGLTVNQARKAVEQAKRSGYGFIDSLKSRLRNLPGYRKDADVSRGHFINMARKAFQDKVFGQLGDENSFVRQKIEAIRGELGDDAARQAEEIMSRYLDKDEYNGKYENVAKKINSFEAFTKLSLSTIKNTAGGLAMPLARTEVIPYAKSALQMFSSEARDGVKEMGVLGSLFRDAANDVGYSSDVGKAYGIQGVEKFLRTFAGLAGQNEAKTLFARAKANPMSGRGMRAKAQLKDLILETDLDAVLQQDSLSQTQIERAANRMVDLTQGRAESLSMPHAWSTPNPTANVLLQFKKYAFIQSKNMKDAMMQNPRMIPRLAVGMLAFGELSADLRALITGRKRPEDLPARAIDDMANAFGFGLASDMFGAIQARSAGEFMRKLAPPIVGSVADLATTGYKAGKSLPGISDISEYFGDETEGSPWPFLREATGRIPFVGPAISEAMKED